MNPFDPERYGPVLASLVNVDRRRPLGKGAAARWLKGRLAGVTLESAFAHTRLVNSNMGRAVLAGMWLVHDFLDESHEVSQAIDTAEGSFWHAIMHRREGDFSNAKYWLRHVGKHEVLPSLGRQVAELAAARSDEATAQRLVTDGDYDPFAFVDLVQGVEAGQRADARELCLDIQQAEWEVLFDWCYGGAVGE